MFNYVCDKIDKICLWRDANPEANINMHEMSECLCLCSMQNKKEREESLASYKKLCEKTFEGKGETSGFAGTKMWRLFSQVSVDIMERDVRLSIDEAFIIPKVMGISQYVLEGNVWDNKEEQQLLERIRAEYDGAYVDYVSKAIYEVESRSLFNLV